MKSEKRVTMVILVSVTNEDGPKVFLKITSGMGDFQKMKTLPQYLSPFLPSLTSVLLLRYPSLLSLVIFISNIILEL